MELLIGVLESVIYIAIGAVSMYLYLYVKEISRSNARLKKKLREMKEERDEEPEVIRVIDVTAEY